MSEVENQITSDPHGPAARERAVRVAFVGQAGWCANSAHLSPASSVGSWPSGTRVVLHWIAYQCFPPATQYRIASHLARVGARATANAPLAWLRFENDPTFASLPSLRFRCWPEGQDRMLATATAHGGQVDWLYLRLAR